jgi:hypothetical protein
MIYFLLMITWLYLGMYSYIFWISKHNKRYRLKWKTEEVLMIPIFAVLGPIMFISGYLLFKQNIKND